MGLPRRKLGKVSAAFLVALLLCGCPGDPVPPTMGEKLRAEKGADVAWPAPYGDALAFYLKDNCDGAWGLLWPLAKQGDNNARFLPTESLLMGCALPGLWDFQKYHADEVRLRVTLYAYAISEPANYSLRDGDRDYFRKVLRNNLTMWLPGEAQAVQACYVSDASAKHCLNTARSVGAMKSFDEVAKEIDSHAKSQDSSR